MSVAVVIERADASTVAEAVPLLEIQFQEHAIDVAGARLEAALRGLLEVPGRGAILLARAGSEPVGVAVLAYTWTLEHGGKCTWLDELYVVPAQRGQGIGLALLRRAMEIARADGCIAIDLEVDADHARAEALYRREGFGALPRRRFARAL